jgi:hypothetical protein
MGVSVRPSTTNFKKSTFGIIVRIQGAGAVPLLTIVKFSYYKDYREMDKRDIYKAELHIHTPASKCYKGGKELTEYIKKWLIEHKLADDDRIVGELASDFIDQKELYDLDYED